MPQTDTLPLTDSLKALIIKYADADSNLSSKEKESLKQAIIDNNQTGEKKPSSPSISLMLVILLYSAAVVYFLFPKFISFLTRLFFSPFKNSLKGDYKYLVETGEKDDEYENEETTPAATFPFAQPTVQAETSHYLLYEGASLDFTEIEYIHALNKRNFFYKYLDTTNKERFIQRVKEFIHHKRFVIHAAGGFKEMRILLAGTAVQLTFGLEEYLLPCFPEIHIYPDAFLGLNPLRVLIGNVSGNAINISWKHFLEGAETPNDNSHVGLHEMAHALYYQNMINKMHADEDFAHAFPLANKVFDEVFNIEKNIDSIYSEYATKNFQEFWAESIEIFFENPDKLKALYPKLYDAICGILNLDPLTPSNPVI